jgi:hypothetical protein
MPAGTDMDTSEARNLMLDLAERGLRILAEYASGSISLREANVHFREIMEEARRALPDAGYPAETAWRALQRAQVGFAAYLEPSEAAYWQDVEAELQTGRDALSSLASTPRARDADFRLIG